MITEIVLFDLPKGITREAMIAQFRDSVPRWQQNPDMIRKHMVFDLASGKGGGVYLWNCVEDAQRWHDDEFDDDEQEEDSDLEEVGDNGRATRRPVNGGGRLPGFFFVSLAKARVDGIFMSAVCSSRSIFSMIASSTPRVAAIAAGLTPRTATRLTSSASGTRTSRSARPLAVSST